jgi:Glycosyl hydrolases family 16/Secretion system C-terminal sorting domain
MQTLKVIAILIIIGFLFIRNAQSQTRQYNESYTYTVLVDNFSGTSLDRTKWRVENAYKRDLGLLKDTPATLRVQNDNLELTMISCPNCTAGSYQGNYAGAEVVSLIPFQNGIFECRAKYAQGAGSWPSFWMIGGDGAPCPPSGYANEIDIAENFNGGISSILEHNIHHYHPSTDCVNSVYHPVDHVNYSFNANNLYHVFKCIRTPTKISYYVDGNLKHEISNTGQICSATGKIWFPEFNLNVFLSQQISQPHNILGQEISPVTPQTSYFDYAKVKQFFLSPEITLSSNIICSSGTALMDVATEATNITWALTPSNLFNGATTGTGKSVVITAASTAQGKGKITYSFNMSNDQANPKEIYTATKDIWIKGPDPSEMTFDVYKSNGVRATKVGNTFLMCANTTYQIYIMNSGPVPLSNYTWTIPSAWTRNYTSQNIISIYTNSSPGGQVIVTATNTASGCNNTIQPITGYMGSTTNCGTYLMAFTPNPSTSESSLVLSADGEKIVDENTQWEFEVYDQQQTLKVKSAQIKGNQSKINTSNWKDGIYLVRVKIGDELISEKLVVKH